MTNARSLLWTEFLGFARGGAVVAAVLAGVAPVPSSAASFEDEMRDLVRNHPQIQAKAKAINSAEEGVRGARSGYFPQARLSGDEGYEYVDTPDRRATQTRPYSHLRNTAGLTVTQKIFDGFKTDATVDAAKVQHSIAGSDLRATRQSSLLEGAIAYLEVLRQTRLIALGRENERKVADQLNLEDERVQKGSGIASDVLAAKQRLQVAKERRVKFEGDFQTAVAKFTQVFGHAPDMGGMADPPLPVDMLPERVDDALDAAERDNPILETAVKTIQLTDERRRIAEADYWPTLDLQAKADYENGKNAVIGVRRDWSLLLVASWDLFSGFKTDAAVAQAAWDNAATKDNRLYTSRKVSEAVQTAWHKLETARTRLDLLDNAANLAEAVWEAQKKKREAGKATVQEVLDEETKINEARINYAGAYYDMYQASYELLSGMGRLEVDNLGRARPTQARPMSPIGDLGPTRPMTGDSRPARPQPAMAAATLPPATLPPVRAILPAGATSLADDSALPTRPVLPAAQTSHQDFWQVR